MRTRIQHASRHYILSHVFFLSMVMIALMLTSGCTPILNVAANTEVREDGACQRSIMFVANPHPHHPNQDVSLKEYLVLPDKVLYDQADVSERRAKFRGIFKTPDDIPVDFMKKSPGTDLLAENRLSVRIRDYALLSVIDYEERIDDIVERIEAEEQLDETVSILTTTLLTALNSKFSQDYDLSKLEGYIRTNLPPFLKRLYSAYWEIRRSRRGGIHDDTEPQEWEERFHQELALLGIQLEPESTAAAAEANSKRLWAYADSHLQELIIPRTKETPPFSVSILRDKKNQTDFLSILELSLKESFGTVEDFRKRMEPLYTSVFGAFTGRSITIEQREPSIEFFYRAMLPGMVVESNAVRDLDGSLIWRFSNRDAILSGYRMWARTIILNHEAIQRLQLRNFPRSLATIEALYDALLTPRKRIDPKRIELLQACIRQGDLRPLRDAANPLNAGRSPVPPDEAQRLLGILGSFYDPDYHPGPKPSAPERKVPTPDAGTTAPSVTAPNTTMSTNATSADSALPHIPPSPEIPSTETKPKTAPLPPPEI